MAIPPRRPRESDRGAQLRSSTYPVSVSVSGFRFSGTNGTPGSKKGTDHSVPNPQSRKRPKRIFGGQSGLSPFLKGRTNLVRVNLAGRRWNRRMAIPARRPREKIHFSVQPHRPPEFVDQIEEKLDRHWRNPGRPRKPAKSKKRTEQIASVPGLRKE